MNDTLGTDTLTLAVKAEVENLLVSMLSADLIAGYSSGQRILTACCVGGVLAHWLPFVALSAVLLYAFL